MLKRFMNWLLNKWQGLFGALGGKRRTSSQALSDRSAQPSRSIDSSDMAIPVAARTPFTPSTESLFKPDVEPVAPVANRPAVLPKIIKPDTHQRIDATSAALTDSVRPVFPTEVSALMGSPLQPGEGSDLPFRTLKKIPDSQLPAIHDLLPATEADESDNQLENPSSIQPAFVENDQPENGLTEDGLTEDGLTEDGLTEASTFDQVVLFSFDIVESETPEDSDHLASDDLVAESLLVDEKPADGNWQDEQLTYESARVEENSRELVAEAVANEDFETNVDSLDTDSINNESWFSPTQQTTQAESFSDLLPEDSVSENAGDTDLESVELESVEPESVEQPVDAPAEPTILTKAEILPYPWSLPVSDLAPQVSDRETSSSLKAVSDTVLDQSSQPVTPLSPPIEETDEACVAKNGIVKLLFTLKEGNFHGYIAPDDGTQDILFHQKYINADIFSQLDRGIKVSVSVKYIEGKAYATYIDLL